MSRHRDMHGFTLIELLVTLALLTIVVAIAVPNFTFLIEKTRLQSKAEELVGFLQFARGEAVTQRTTATIAIDANGPWVLSIGGNDRLFEHIPEQTQLLANVAAVTYRANGTATPALITVCLDEKPEKGFVVEIQASGAARLHSRGRAIDGSELTSCEP